VSAQAQFSDVTDELGIFMEAVAPGHMGGGCMWFDHNNDGWEDMYMCGGEGMDKLYENNGDGTFTDITTGSGLEFTVLVHTFGVAGGDMDNDGDTDIILTTWYDPSDFTHPPIMILENMGGGLFLDMAEDAGVDDHAFNSSAALLDINLDGWLDIYVGNYIFFNDFLEEDGVIYGYDHDCYADYLYINNQDGTFTESAEDYEAINPGCTLAVAATDHDRDGDTDLMVANDFGEWIVPDILFDNQYPDLNVEEIGEVSGADIQLYGMGVATGDFDEDLDLDYYVTNLGENALLKQQNGMFEEVAQELGVINGFTDSLRHTGWGTFFFDHNNDSYLDLFVVNGRIPAFDFVANIFYDSNKLFENGPDFSFEDVTQPMGLADSLVGRGCSYADFDHDGDLDILLGTIPNLTSLPEIQTFKLYRNDMDNDNHWVTMTLQGVTANPDGFGAQVEVHAGGRTFLREITGGGPHASQNSNVIHVGLGEINFVDSAQVFWPGGEVQTVFLNVDENTSVTQGEIFTEAGSRSSEISLYPNPTKGNLTVISPTLGLDSRIIVTSVQGKTILDTRPSKIGKVELTLPQNLAEGTYLLQIFNRGELMRAYFVLDR